MKYLLLFCALLTGCASTNINGIEPGDNQMLKVVGSMLVIGVLSNGLAKPGMYSCISTVKNNVGQNVGTISTTKSSPC